MTELNSYSINNNLNVARRRAEYSPVSYDNLGYSAKFPVVRYPRLDSKLILQNMEEVLHSVNKQHREKHRRKKQLKKLAMVEAANGPEMVPQTEGVLKDQKKEQFEKKHKHRDREKCKSRKNVLHDKSTLENGKVLQESPVKSGTILQHFLRTPQKDDHLISQEGDNEAVAKGKSESETKKQGLEHPNNSKVTNAFEVMMNARNKSIGSNTTGKDPLSTDGDEVGGINAKRKLKLMEWAEQKGGAKRKLEEEARAAYVDEQLEQRAKRFKHMLVSGASSPKTSQNITKTNKKISTKKNRNQEPTQKIKTKKHRGRRIRRLSSDDSASSLELLPPTKLDAETSEFLEKLSSPTKKRDSLLGYFHKKDSPTKIFDKKISEQTKKYKDRNDTKNVCRKTISNTNIPKSHQLQEDEGRTLSSRPRRSCTGKARYDYDLEISPSKIAEIETTQSRKLRKSTKVSKEPESVDTIILDDSTNLSGCDITMLNETPKKLAPLFMRSLPKPSPDPEIVKARRAFLESGVPEKLRLEQDRQKQYEQNFEETTEIFPKISHINQLSKNDLESYKELDKYSLKINSEETILLSSSPMRKSKIKSKKQQFIVGSLSDCIKNKMQLQNNSCQDICLGNISLPSLENKRAIIKNWKAEFERFPTFKCYNQMREKYRYFSAIDSAPDIEQVSESFVVTRQTRRAIEEDNKKESHNPDEEYEPPATAPNGELLFSEKYKPLLYEQILVNLNPVTQLKEFLSNWSNSSSVNSRNSQIFDDSADLNDSTSSNLGQSTNTVVLLGPVSSGKTNAVFALANEMNFNVLEINAGMKRTGKRLIQELQEATQSHQIRKDAAGTGSSQKSLLKMSLNGLKSKLKRRNSNSNQLENQTSDSNSSDLQHSSRKCLILIEDADVVFEQTDAGFTDAIYSLAASSKRPVIIVATNPNCAHLQRLISQNTINFPSPNVLNISKFLAVLSLIENCPVQLDDIVSLYLYNRRDLRKTLLELQFFIQSGGDRIRQLHNEQDSRTIEKEKPNYFASPPRRQFSADQQESLATDNMSNDKTSTSCKSSDQVYIHHSLFEYYTVCQNSQWRIPFPVDFRLLNVNLNEIFQVSRKLKEDINHTSCEKTFPLIKSNRRSKSPKKQWLTEAGSNFQTSLDNLCSFYENLSIAALLDERDIELPYQNKPKPSIIDRLNPNISENISHCLLEKSIEVNLKAELCPYNLFDTTKNSVSLCDELGLIQMRSYRSRYLDYEPSIRSICRSEKLRSTLERRSTRFYHYLRNYSINMSNFSYANFDQACEAFQFSDAKENEAA